MEKNILIGGAWPYANYLLHIGHLAALLPGDVIARYYRGTNAKVIYVSGTDCHGTPITERAKKENKSPKEISTYYHNEFVKTFDRLNFSYDLYASTDDEEHKQIVKEYFKTLYNNGYIYEKEENQDFCLKCNVFLSDREIEGICPHCGKTASGDQCDFCFASLNNSEVLHKHCKECKEETIAKTNKHLYFKLSYFQQDIANLIENRKKYWRKNATTETQKFIDMGLIDRAVTRQLDWGVEVPIDGYEDKRIYVWIEAVLGYLTTSLRVAKERNININDFLSNDNNNLSTYFVHGKDNITFHTIIYPSLLIGLNNNYQLPKYIVSSEYINMNDEKMSKSKGNLITANELLDEFDVDTIRYYIIANGPEKKDTNFTKNDFIQTHNKFLVGVLGNFINRNLSFINKKFDGIIVEAKVAEEVVELTKKTYLEVGELIEKAELKSALEKVIDYLNFANKYYDDKKPWIKVKEDINAFNEITYSCCYIMANVSNLLYPFIPNCAQKIKNLLNLQDYSWEIIELKGNIKINNLDLLFQRIDI